MGEVPTSKMRRALFFVAVLFSFGIQLRGQTICADSIPLSLTFGHGQNWTVAQDTGRNVFATCWVGDRSASHGNMNWRIGNGTPTQFTGPNRPSSFFTGRVDNFVYFEASAPLTSVNDSASFYSPPISLVGTVNPVLSFDYFMYGADIGSLQVDVFDGQTWHFREWSISGEQHLEGDYFTRMDINLSEFIGDTIVVQFKGIRGNGNAGDIALDNVSLRDEGPCAKAFNIGHSNLTANSVDIQWLDTASALYYKVYYRVADTLAFFPANASFVVVNASSCTLSGLQPATDYEVYVESFCDSVTSSSIAGPYRVSTLCGSFQIPYDEDFQDERAAISPPGANFLPNCWSSVRSDSASAWDNAFVRDIGFFVSFNALDFNTDLIGSTDTVFLTLPQMSGLKGFNSRLVLTGWTPSSLSVPPTMAKVLVGTMTDPQDPSTFHYITAFQFAAASLQFTQKIDSLSNYNGTDEYIALALTGYHDQQTAQRAIIANISLEEIPACPVPDSTGIRNLTSQSAEVYFTGPGTAFDIQYGPTGFALGSGIMDSTTSNHFTMTGLQSNTVYDVYVQNNCNPNDSVSDWSAVTTFRTRCDDRTLPYFEDFSAQLGYSPVGDVIDSSCWSGSLNSWPQSQFYYVNQSLYLFTYWINKGDTNLLYLPQFSDLDSGIYELSFTSYMGAFANELDLELMVGTSSDPSSAKHFHPLDTFLVTVNSTRSSVMITVPNGYNGTDTYLAFGVIMPRDGVYSEMFIDDVEVSAIDTCGAPSNLTSITLGRTSAQISWDGVAPAYMVEYGPTGYIPGSGVFRDTVFNTNSTTLLGLNPGTSYDVYVFAYCDSLNLTAISGPVEMSTDCAPFTIPLFENFDTSPVGAASPDCWTYLSSHLALSIGQVDNVSTFTRPNAYAFYKSSMSSSDTMALVSPEILGLDSGYAYVEFSSDRSFWGGNIGEFYFATFADPSDWSTMHVMDTIVLDNTTSTQQRIYLDSISGYNGTDRYIGFVSLSNTSPYGFWIDNVRIFNQPRCAQVRSLQAYAIDNQSAYISWESSYGTGFEIRATLKGAAASNGVPTWTYNAFSDTIVGLQSFTEYDIYVRDTCGSAWRGPISIRTYCDQPLRGRYTVLSTPGPRNFPTIQEALHALHYCGVDSSVVIQLPSGVFISSLVLDSIPGASAANEVIIRGSSGAVTELYSTALNQVALLVSSSRHLKIRNVNFNILSGTALLIRGVQDIEVDSCVFFTNSGIGQGIRSETGYPSDRISIQNSSFDRLSSHIYLVGIDSLILYNNEFVWSLSSSVHMENVRGVHLKENRMNHGALSVSHGKDIVIEKNHISSFSGGLVLTNIETENRADNWVRNNMISADNTGLILQFVQSTEFLHNSIRSRQTAINGSYLGSGLSFYNNILYGSKAMHFDNIDAIVFDYNCYYASNPNQFVYTNGEDYFDLGTLQIDFPSKNNHSITGAPLFTSRTDLHVRGPLVNDMGTNQHTVPEDIDGETRPWPNASYVDIGADEFAVVRVDLAIEAVLLDSNICAGRSPDVKVAVLNFGYDTLKYSNFIIDAFGSTQNVGLNFVLPPFERDTLLLGHTNSPANGGTQSVRVVADAFGDTNTVNDTALNTLSIPLGSPFQIQTSSSSVCLGDSAFMFVYTPTQGRFVWVYNSMDTLAITGRWDTVWSKPMSVGTQSYQVYHLPDTSECQRPTQFINLTHLPTPMAQFNHATGAPNLTYRDVFFDASSTLYADSIFWSFGDGSSGSGTQVIHPYQQNGTYTVMLYAFNACGVDSAVQFVVVEDISLSELEPEPYTILPNPNRGQFTVHFIAELYTGRVDIFSASGQRVHTRRADGAEQLNFDLEVPSGVYFLQFSGESLRQTEKMIITSP